MELSIADIMVFLCYFAGVITIGLWVAKREKKTADEYLSSIGPIPKVKQPVGIPVGGKGNPGHSPGTNWFYYRDKNGGEFFGGP